MPFLNLGENVVPYQHATPQRMRHAAKGKAARPRPAAQYTQTTLSVARILEAKYHVMEVYFRVHGR